MFLNQMLSLSIVILYDGNFYRILNFKNHSSLVLTSGKNINEILRNSQKKIFTEYSLEVKI